MPSRTQRIDVRETLAVTVELLACLGEPNVRVVPFPLVPLFASTVDTAEGAKPPPPRTVGAALKRMTASCESMKSPRRLKRCIPDEPTTAHESYTTRDGLMNGSCLGSTCQYVTPVPHQRSAAMHLG